MYSIWRETVNPVNFDKLSENKHTDVLIVGGGIAGILCAYMLKKQGVDCIVAEADEICGKTTQNTTAKISIQHGLIYDKLIRQKGLEFAGKYLKAQILACKEYQKLCSDIPCDYEIADSYVYSIDDLKKIHAEAAALAQLGIKASTTDVSYLPIGQALAVCVKKQAQFNPLKFLFGISKDLPIYEHTKVLEISKNKAITHGGTITFNKVIIATHFPIINKHGGYFLKMYQHRSYVLALENAQKVDGIYVDESLTGLSFRNYKNLLLLGGGSHRTGKTGGNWQELEAFAHKHYPRAKTIAKWATQDCMTLDGIPYIGQYSRNTPNMFVTTGFNKWGMSSAMLSAMILNDLITGKTNKFASIFSPSRSMLHPQLAINAFESAVGLLTPTSPRCPHLGCALKYNRHEHSWDCPCHGSRFSKSGKLIDTPATADKKNL
ncbi:MAG: FAD-dependent oxidoreductase [Ruminococcaceae bacterium]|nr:FAD-dependent oxidoreductase [Oscillospiraceae bacterium]